MALLALAVLLPGCVAYEYEHEFWLQVGGAGTVHITGRPELWTSFKNLRPAGEPGGLADREAVRALLARSGLNVRRVTLTRRAGRAYLFVSADFEDLNALAGSEAFPDLDVSLVRVGDRLRLSGVWRRPPVAPDVPGLAADGLMAVRFHLPSKVYAHDHAFAGVERGNIVAWRQTVAQGLDGRDLRFGALMDRSSILGATVVLFVAAILLALSLLALGLYLVFRKGRRELQDRARQPEV